MPRHQKAQQEVQNGNLQIRIFPSQVPPQPADYQSKTVRVCKLNVQTNTYADIAVVRGKGYVQLLDPWESPTMQRLHEDICATLARDVLRYRVDWGSYLDEQRAIYESHIMLPETYTTTFGSDDVIVVVLDGWAPTLDSHPFIAIYTMLVYKKDKPYIVPYIVYRSPTTINDINPNVLEQIRPLATLTHEIQLRLSDTNGLSDGPLKRKLQMGYILGFWCLVKVVC